MSLSGIKWSFRKAMLPQSMIEGVSRSAQGCRRFAGRSVFPIVTVMRQSRRNSSIGSAFKNESGFSQLAQSAVDNR